MTQQTLRSGLDARLAEFEAHVGELQSRTRGSGLLSKPDDIRSVVSADRTESTVTNLLQDPAVALARREKFLAFAAQRSNSNQ